MILLSIAVFVGISCLVLLYLINKKPKPVEKLRCDICSKELNKETSFLFFDRYYCIRCFNITKQIHRNNGKRN